MTYSCLVRVSRLIPPHRALVSSLKLSVFLLALLTLACGKKGDPTLASYEKPAAPSGVKAIHRESQIILLWEFPQADEENLKGFHILKALEGDFGKIAFLEKNARSFVDPHVIVNREHRYKIVSESLKGVTRASSELRLLPLAAPNPPGRLSFTIAHDILTITWEKSSEKNVYYIYKSTSPGQYPLAPLNAVPLREPSFRDAFDVNRAMFYTVRTATESPFRDEGLPSEELAINPVELIPSPPENFVALPASDGVYLLWKEPPETWVTGYNVYRKLPGDAAYVSIGAPQTPAFFDGEKAGGRRSYRVTAVGPLKESEPAEIRDVDFAPMQ